MTPLSITLLLFASAQSVGGGSDNLHQFFGIDNHDQLGSSLANAGDVDSDGFDDIVVGSPRRDQGGLADSGIALVYSGRSGSQLYFLAGANAEDQFGYAVSGGGDLNRDGFDDILVGAPYADPNGLANAGSAYVYSGQDGSLMYQWDGEVLNSAFGTSVSLAGDLNSDGFDDVLIGSPNADLGTNIEPGAVYAYSGLDGSLLYRWIGNQDYGGFGWSVAGGGHLNADSVADVIIGSPFVYLGSSFFDGTVSTYSGSDGAFIQEWSGGNGEALGYSVSHAGDLNNDGFGEILVGAYSASTNGLSKNGTAYAYSGIDGSTLYQWNGSADNDGFGYSVSGVDLDGTLDVLIGVPFTDQGGLTNAGSSSLYNGNNGSLLYEWQGSHEHGHFGLAVSGAGHSNDDPYDDVMIGSPSFDTPSKVNIGAAFVYTWSPFLRTETETISASSAQIISLDLDFPSDVSNGEYRVLFSATGTGSFTHGVEIPLSLDALVVNSYFGNYPFPLSGDLQGNLDFSGNTIAEFGKTPGNFTGSVGRTFWVAAIASQPGNVPQHSSVAVAITITP